MVLTAGIDGSKVLSVTPDQLHQYIRESVEGYFNSRGIPGDTPFVLIDDLVQHMYANIAQKLDLSNRLQSVKESCTNESWPPSGLSQ